MRVAVIMAGGSGERFWPLSRSKRPKQLLRLTESDRTMLQVAVERIGEVVLPENVFIATTAALHETISDAGYLPIKQILSEPDRRNTLGCLTWAVANLAAQQGGFSKDISMAVLTADHDIQPTSVFCRNVAEALEIAERTQGLVTIGIVPTRPETGYGYIEIGEKEQFGQRVISFREKPDADLASEFLSRGNFLWNSGMFFWTLNGFLHQLRNASPEAAKITEEMAALIAEGKSANEAFLQLKGQSIDYALMEKAESVYVVPAQFMWDDVGSFDALLRTFPKDQDGNICVGEVRVSDCANCVFYNEDPDSVLTAVGLRDHIVVQTKDASVTLPISHAQKVKDILPKLKGWESAL